MPAMSIPAISAGDISIAAIVVSDDCPIADIVHAKPLPAHMACTRKKLTRSAVKRRRRGMVMQHTRRPSMQKVPATVTGVLDAKPIRTPPSATTAYAGLG